MHQMTLDCRAMPAIECSKMPRRQLLSIYVLPYVSSSLHLSLKTKTANLFLYHPISSESTRQERLHHDSISTSGMGSYFDSSKGGKIGSGTPSAAKCAFAFCNPQ